MSTLAQNLRYAIRMFRKTPSFAVIAVLALAFGIGVNSAIFTLLNALVLRPLPVKNADEVVTVYQMTRGLKSRNVHGSRYYVSFPEYAAYRDQSHVFSGLAAFALAPLTLGGPDAHSLQGHLVTCNYFPVMTGPLPLGRDFLQEECGVAGASPVVVLSHAFWQRQFAGDPAIIGKTIVLNRTTFTIVGIGPAGFTGASVIGADVWAPVSMQEQWLPGRKFVSDANLSWLELAGRLKPGATLAAARADLAVVAARIDQQVAGRKTTLAVDAATLMNNPEGRGPVLGVGAVILAAVSLVLLIACANLANLLLARAAARQKEIAVRLAVGASRGRLIGQLLTESLLVALAGGTLGVLAAWGTLRGVYPILIGKLPQEVSSLGLNLNPDLRILLYSLLLAFATGISFGLIPALQSSKFDLNSALKETGAAFDGSSRGWLRGALVTAQVAVCLVLLIAAGLLLRGLHSAQMVEPGFTMKGIATAGFDLTREGYDQARAGAFHRQLAERLASRSGVDLVGFADPIPLSGARHGNMVAIEGREGNHQVNNAHVSANYFHILDIPIVLGRAFEERETRGDQHVAIVSESTARRFWPGGNPVGKHIRFGQDRVHSEVVGVARDIRSTSLSAVDAAFVYLPLNSRDQLNLKVLVRGAAGYATIAKSIAEESRALDPNVLTRPAELADNLDLWQLPSRVLSILALVLGSAGLLLAALGIYAW